MTYASSGHILSQPLRSRHRERDARRIAASESSGGWRMQRRNQDVPGRQHISLLTGVHHRSSKARGTSVTNFNEQRTARTRDRDVTTRQRDDDRNA